MGPLLTFLLACVEEKLDTGTAPIPPWELDADGDGLTSDVDCDDDDAGVYPGASETCDGVDQDCDGETDEDARDATTWYPDDDGDGYGDAFHGSRACDPIDGRLATGGDCDDADAEQHPGADEACNGEDDDCDDETDEGTSPTTAWYADDDGDGFGNPNGGSLACVAPDGSVADATDCDDADPLVHPGADEHCDRADEDCDGTVDDAPVDGVPWYADADGDRYGDPASSQVACSRPTGTSPDATDCDDTTADVSPDAVEHCDDRDEDCDGDVDEDAVDAPVWYVDADGDGWGTSSLAACDAPVGTAADAGDCDDADAEIHPDAAETCDAVDEDCDGTADDGAVDAPSWYADTDADGYGDPAVVTADCEAPTGWIADATDCDDADADVHPGVDETCDDRDEDCDGSTDEDPVDPDTWYADADGDGHGDAASTLDACDAPTGYVADGGDCDDAEALVAPGRGETCGDGLDNDCDGSDDGCVRTGDDALGDVYQAMVRGTDPGGEVGEAVALLGDVDGDGADDFAVTAESLGELWVFAGPPYGDLSGTDADGWYVGTDLGAVAGGDLDDDGTEDVAFAAEGYVLLQSGPWTGGRDYVDATAWVAASSTDRLGDALAVGDLDGDGVDDLVMGAPGATGDASSSGVVYVLYGRAFSAGAPVAADSRRRGTTGSMQLGASVAVVGDVDGDGLPDLLAGAPNDRTSGLLAGAAYLFSGPVSGADACTTATAIFTGEDLGDRAGYSVGAAGDTDGDGQPELLVGAPYADANGADSGAAYLLRGPFSGTTSLSAATATLAGGAAMDEAGWTVAGAGDFDGDGFDDWAFGAWAADPIASQDGAVYLVYGPGPWTTVDYALLGAAESRAGMALAGGRDVTGDGLDDLLVGAPWYSSQLGAAWLVAGSGW